jgi:hypothetical protein
LHASAIVARDFQVGPKAQAPRMSSNDEEFFIFFSNISKINAGHNFLQNYTTGRHLKRRQTPATTSNSGQGLNCRSK